MRTRKPGNLLSLRPEQRDRAVAASGITISHPSLSSLPFIVLQLIEISLRVKQSPSAGNCSHRVTKVLARGEVSFAPVPKPLIL